MADTAGNGLWDERFMAVAQLAATWSEDRSVGVGAAVVSPDQVILSIGYNGFPRGVSPDQGDRHLRPAKYMWTEHAERNAIYAAARVGAALKGARMYLTWFPCAACARAIVQAGISTLVTSRQPDPDDPTWGEEFQVSVLLLAEGGVTIKEYMEVP
jgi:dCMP deaminase